MKLKLIITMIIMSIMLLPVLAQGLPDIKEIEIDDITVFKDGSLVSDARLRIERGDQVDIEVLLEGGNEDSDDTQLLAFVTYEFSGESPLGDATPTFDIDAGTLVKKTLRVTIPTYVDADAYQFRFVLADRNSNTTVLHVPVAIQPIDEGFEIDDVIVYPSNVVRAGQTVLITARIENIGDGDEDDVRVTASIDRLNLRNSVYIDSIEEGDEVQTEEIPLSLPLCATPGVYQVNIEYVFKEGFRTGGTSIPLTVVEGDRCDMHSGDNSDSEDNVDKTPKTIIVVGSQLETLAQGGEGVIYPITLTNDATRSTKTYTLLVEGLNTHFAEMRVSPTSTVVLQPGETQSLYIFVRADEDAPLGPHVFTASVLSGGETLDQITLTANVVEGEGSSLKSVLEVGLIVLVIILIIVALVVAFNRNRDNDEDDDDEITTETYY